MLRRSQNQCGIVSPGGVNPAKRVRAALNHPLSFSTVVNIASGHGLLPNAPLYGLADILRGWTTYSEVCSDPWVVNQMSWRSGNILAYRIVGVICGRIAGWSALVTGTSEITGFSYQAVRRDREKRRQEVMS